jgi:hypothetical protein
MCPLCHSKKMRCSRVKAWDFLFLILQAQPMRCHACHHRFYRWPWSAFGHHDLAWRHARPASQPAPDLTAFKPQKRVAATASGKR